MCWESVELRSQCQRFQQSYAGYLLTSGPSTAKIRLDPLLRNPYYFFNLALSSIVFYNFTVREDSSRTANNSMWVKGAVVLNEHTLVVSSTCCGSRADFFHHLHRLCLHCYTSTQPLGFFLVGDDGCYTRSGKSNHLKKKLSSCTLQAQLYSPVPSFSKHEQLNQNRKPLSQQGKKNIPFVLRVWLLSSLTGSLWVWKVPELRVSVGMWPKVEECGLGALSFSLTLLILRNCTPRDNSVCSTAHCNGKYLAGF